MNGNHLKPGLTDQTFKTFKQTSTTIPLLAQYLLEEMDLEYVLTGKIQSDFLEKRFGRYRQLSGANYFATEMQFFEAEKAIRVTSLIKFSDYSITEVQAIMKKDEVVSESMVQSHAGSTELLSADTNIVFLYCRVYCKRFN